MQQYGNHLHNIRGKPIWESNSSALAATLTVMEGRSVQIVKIVMIHVDGCPLRHLCMPQQNFR
jgi:hypothetical protein